MWILSSVFPVAALSGFSRGIVGFHRWGGNAWAPLQSCQLHLKLRNNYGKCLLIMSLNPAPPALRPDWSLFNIRHVVFLLGFLKPALPTLFLKYANNFLWNNWPAHLKVTGFLFQPCYPVLFDERCLKNKVVFSVLILTWLREECDREKFLNNDPPPLFQTAYLVDPRGELLSTAKPGLDHSPIWLLLVFSDQGRASACRDEDCPWWLIKDGVEAIAMGQRGLGESQRCESLAPCS